MVAIVGVLLCVSAVRCLADIVVFATPVVGRGTNGVCPGPYVERVTFSKAPTNGWGWAPSTNTTIHTATDTNRSDTKVEFTGKSGDSGCNQTSVTAPHPPTSITYRFTIYFTNTIPTTPYPILLSGFNP